MREFSRAGLGRRLVAAMIGLAAVLPTTPAAAITTYRETISFFSLVDIQRGELGVLGTATDPDIGSVVAQTRACCFQVASVASGGNPATIRTFGSLDTVSQFYFMGVSMTPSASVGADLAVTASQAHLVLALNQVFSATLTGREFNSVFTGFDETQMIADIVNDFSGLATPEERAGAATRLSLFQNRLFDLGAGFAASSTFALTSFSSGVSAGTGFANPTVTAAVPDPATWATMLLGVGMVGGAARRRRMTAAPDRKSIA